MVLKLYQKIKGSSFLKNISTIAFSLIFIQFFSLLISPLLSRLYEPEDFSLLVLITSIVSIFSPLFHGGYAMAIVVGELKMKNKFYTFFQRY